MTWTLLWLAWGAAFLVIEGVALWRDHRRHGTDDEDRTLSDHLRRWFRVDTNRGRTVWLLFSALFFVAWFIPHIGFGTAFGNVG